MADLEEDDLTNDSGTEMYIDENNTNMLNINNDCDMPVKGDENGLLIDHNAFLQNSSVDHLSGNGEMSSSDSSQLLEMKPPFENEMPYPTNLPECRSKRSYVCGYCNLKTLNPREYLYHLRDEHGEDLKRIFECSRCVYASKSLQKLVRHNQMVHKTELTPEEKKPRNLSKPTKPPQAKPGFSPMNRSPRESKSPRRFEEFEFLKEGDLDFEEETPPPRPPSKNSVPEKPVLHCDQCEFTTTSFKVLSKHETKDHLKRRFFRCSKCNYATHVKGRYVKHMKYHEMPIIQCEWCDFSTPYPWNLDRHNKNHTENMGDFQCHLCNFTAQNKQTLTVHVANHHLTPEQIKNKEAKRLMGLNEMEGMTEEEIEMLRMERDEDPSAFEFNTSSNGQSFTVANIEMGSQEETEAPISDANGEVDGEPKRKKPKIKMTFKKMKSNKEAHERHNFNDDFIHPDDIVDRHGNLYIKNEKCPFCSFKAAFRSDLKKHLKKEHGFESNGGESSETKASHLPNSANTTDSSDNSQDGMLGSPFDHDTAEDLLKYKLNSNKIDDYNQSELTEKSSDQGSERDSSREGTPKKKGSFFDKLQEKFSLSNIQNLVCQFCGHESKCLSESVRHQKLHLSAKNIFASASLSTRCQFCRHRCKSTDDLMTHLKSCGEARKNLVADSETEALLESVAAQESNRDSVLNRDSESPNRQHPMENRVFVWNTLAPGESSEKSSSDENKDCPPKSTISSCTFAEYGINNPDAEMPETELSNVIVNKKVYRCPQCNFWSVTPNRFHVHVIGHANKKPYCCSDCDYRSNWRKEVIVHIKVKAMTNEEHSSAEALIFDETCEKNYDKYDQYQTVISINEVHSNRTEGGLPFTRKSQSRRNSDDSMSDSTKSSPCPTPSSSGKMPAPPKLTRAPNRRVSNASSPVPNAVLAAAIAGLQPPLYAAQNGGSDADKLKFSMKPPPLVAMGQLSQSLIASASTSGSIDQTKDAKDPTLPTNYQIITNQGAMSTSLETLQLLASGSTNLAKLKKEGGDETTTSSSSAASTANGADGTGGGGSNAQENDASALSNQMRLLILLNCLSRGAEQKEGEKVTPNQVSAATGNSGTNANPNSSIMQLVLDHEGNPEWKCSTCDFRDNEQDTVAQHVRLAHGKKGSISLVHAVHRCSVCGFAAGTKRHVLLHIETSHGGRGGIISRSEGQNVAPDTGDDNSRSFDCKLCPFTCKKRSELKTHLAHHTPRVDFVFKCMFCPYYVATKNDLFEHLSVHGMEIPASAKTSAPSSAPTIAGGSSTNKNSNTQEDDSRQFICDACPFEAKTRVKLMHHKQFHKPRGLPFSCNHCSYNVTRRHLLAQHLKIHGVSPTELEGNASISENSLINKRPFIKATSGSKSPSPSLTITPISAASGNSAAATAEKEGPKIDPSCLPTITQSQTAHLLDIPLVWVSREKKYFKMFKCRHCPHVNNRKSNIQEHEKMHKPEGPPPNGHKCQWCTYSCINAGVMTSHVKVHAGAMGTCHVIVDPSYENYQQLFQLARNSMKSTLLDKLVKKSDEKQLYFCQHCPSRFFYEKEVFIHSRFHGSTNFANRCDKCSFCVRDAPQLSAHSKVHTPEYTDRTKTLMSMHPTSPSYPPVPGLSLPQEDPSNIKPVLPNDLSEEKKPQSVNGITKTWIPPSVTPSASNQPPPTNRFKCDQCPSSFTKIVTLQYHQSLHRADNPFKCQRCTYTAKTQVGLDQHVELHNQADLEKANSESENSNSTLSSPQRPQMFPSSASSADSETHPPIKLKFIGLKGDSASTSSSSSSSNSKKQFKYYIEEQVPLSGIELLKRKTQIEKEMPKEEFKSALDIDPSKFDVRPCKNPGNEGNPKLNYPLHIDKASGRAREKRHKCSKCPSAFEKLDQYNVHKNLHGSNFKYKCRICDYSVKFYANFMMHIKRHKYHERVDAQNKGLSPPSEDQLKFEPFIGRGEPPEEFKENLSEEVDNKENQTQQNYGFDMPPGITTAEKQQLILQHKKADAFKPKDEDKKVYYCQYCPYSNTRRDAVDSHSYRHQSGNPKLYQCNYCDYSASQPNFIRDHTKYHFRPFKYVQPEGFMRHEKQEIWSTKSGDQVLDEDIPKRSLSFSHEEGLFTPDITTSKTQSDNGEVSDPPKDLEDPQAESGILIDFRSGDVVEAPSTYIIPLRTASRSKSITPVSNGTVNKDYLFAKPTTRISSRNSRKKAKYEIMSPPNEPEHEEPSNDSYSEVTQAVECKTEPEVAEELAQDPNPVENPTIPDDDAVEGNIESMDTDQINAEDPPLSTENEEQFQEEPETPKMEIDETSAPTMNHAEEDMATEYQNGYHEDNEEMLEESENAEQDQISAETMEDGEAYDVSSNGKDHEKELPLTNDQISTDTLEDGNPPTHQKVLENVY